jgi:hypothetical protein
MEPSVFEARTRLINPFEPYLQQRVAFPALRAPRRRRPATARDQRRVAEVRRRTCRCGPHNAPPDYRFKSISPASCGASPNTSNANCATSAVEPVIGQAKGEHRMGRNYLAGQTGDAINAVLAAAGYNF